VQWLVLAVVATACPVYVTEPIVELGAVQGNTGVRVPAIIAAVQEVILAAGGERSTRPNGETTSP